MDPDGRLCELDRMSHGLVLVYSIHPNYHQNMWNQLFWTQKQLWYAAQDGESI